MKHLYARAGMLGCVLLVATWGVLAAEQRRPKLEVPPPPVFPEITGERKALQDALIGQSITLLRELHTISYASLGRPGLTQGILTLAPNKPPFFRFTEIPDGGPLRMLDIRDSDPQRLLDKVQAARPPAFAASTKLLTYPAGTRMTVVDCRWGGALLQVSLNDEFAGSGIGVPQHPTTSVSVLWPQHFSPTFLERAEVEILFDTVLKRGM